MDSTVYVPETAAAGNQELRSSREGDNQRRLVFRKGVPDTKGREQELLDIVSFTAATINHEVNNPLMSILATVEMLLNSPREMPPDIKDRIIRIGAEAERIREVIETLIDIEHLRFRQTDGGKLIEL